MASLVRTVGGVILVAIIAGVTRIRQTNVQRRRAVVQPGTLAYFHGTVVTKRSTRHLAGVVQKVDIVDLLVRATVGVPRIRQTNIQRRCTIVQPDTSARRRGAVETSRITRHLAGLI